MVRMFSVLIYLFGQSLFLSRFAALLYTFNRLILHRIISALASFFFFENGAIFIQSAHFFCHLLGYIWYELESVNAAIIFSK